MTATQTDHPPRALDSDMLVCQDFAQPDAAARLSELGDDDWLSTVVLPDSGAAACLDHDPELFFAETPEGVESAKRICLDCPLRTECLAGALMRREPHGVWGGELFAAGVVVPRKRPRGRPRKHPLAA